MFDPSDRLPYIPPPDYSPLIRPVNSRNIYVKNKKPERKVSIDVDAYDEFEPTTIPQPRDDHGRPHNYVPFQVSQADPNWSFCMNRQGQKGWIPTRELNFATSSTGSSPMST
uniref:SH3 domain-containing protein n=1 Tax=Bursaphelenchus xylophilus TaxID=6326 RepID=A0A1I7RJB7_BURXY